MLLKSHTYDEASPRLLIEQLRNITRLNNEVWRFTAC